MYAIIRSGGKQYKVQPGDVLRLEKVEADLGTELDITDVLAISGEKMIVGEPTVKDAKVTVVVTNQKKAPRVIIFKKKRRQGYRRLTGHRQPYTEVFVKAISGPAGVAMADTQAKVFDPAKKQDRDQRKSMYRNQAGAQAVFQTSPSSSSAERTNKETASEEVKVKTTKKAATATKKATKKAAAKKAGAKKRAVKKTARSTKKTTTTKKKRHKAN